MVAYTPRPQLSGNPLGRAEWKASVPWEALLSI